MGTGAGKENVKITPTPKVTPNKSIKENLSNSPPPQKRKKTEKPEEDVFEKLSNTISDFIGHRQKVDEERNSIFRDFLGMYAQANKLQKD